MADSFQPDSFAEDKPPAASPQQGQGPLFSSPQGFYGPGFLANLESRMSGRSPQEVYKQTTPTLEKGAQMAASVAMPWSKAVGSLGLGIRSLQGGAIAGGGSALGGNSPVEVGKQAAIGAVAQPIGEGAFNVGRYFLSNLPGAGAATLFAKNRAGHLMEWLQQNVPAWREMKIADPQKWLHESAHGTGQRSLSEWYEGQLTKVKDAIPANLKVEIPGFVEIAGQQMPTATTRNARALLEELPVLRKKGGKEYYEALDALTSALEGVPLKGIEARAGDTLSAARNAYKLGKGWMDFAEHGKFLHGEKYDPARAMAALDTYAKKDLLSRQLDRVREIVRGPGANPTQSFKPSGLGYRFGSEAVGAGLGHAAGGIPGGAVGGVAGALVPRPSLTRNVPISGVSEMIRAASPSLLSTPLRVPAEE